MKFRQMVIVPHRLLTLSFLLALVFLVFVPGSQTNVAGQAEPTATPSGPSSTETSPPPSPEPLLPTETPVPFPVLTSTNTPEEMLAQPTSTQAILQGQVSFQGYPAPPHALLVTGLQLSLMLPGSDTPAAQYDLTSDENGTFVQTDLPPGTYHLQVKHANRIPALKWNLTLNPGNNDLNFGILKAGDANNDGYVTATDFSLLSSAYGKCRGEAMYDARSDYNGDECITAIDFSLLSTNYGQGGTLNPLPTPTPFPTLTPLPIPTPTSTPEVPASARITNITGKNQALPLNCESSAATNWAGYYGVSLNDVTFHNQLPLSDNPDYGFVGSVYGTWGQIPPHAYGVHADPIAAQLRNYGLNAMAVHNYPYRDLQKQIASGHPAEVWVIGHVWAGTPVQYTDSQGRSTLVARYEHTVLFIGYDPANVYILDGNMVYQRSVSAFLDSWAVLGNMAVIHSN